MASAGIAERNQRDSIGSYTMPLDDLGGMYEAIYNQNVIVASMIAMCGSNRVSAVVRLTMLLLVMMPQFLLLLLLLLHFLCCFGGALAAGAALVLLNPLLLRCCTCCGLASLLSPTAPCSYWLLQSVAAATANATARDATAASAASCC